MKGEKCNSPKKILKACLLLLFCSVFLCSWLFSASVSALERQPSYYNAYYSVYTQSADWTTHIAQNQAVSMYQLYRYEWLIDNVQFTGNIANLHFETNIVLADAPANGRFHNTDLLTISYCGSSGNNINVRAKNISSIQTRWNGQMGGHSYSTDNITLTIYGDVILTGLPTTGTHDLYCGIQLSNNWAFAAVNPPSVSSPINSMQFAFEQQPTSLVFQSSESEALQRQQIDILNNVNQSIQDGSQNIVNAIQNQYDEQDSKYEAQSEQSQSDINDSTADAETQSSNLITLLTTIFETIRDSSPSNCVVYLDLSRYNGGSRVSTSFCPSGYTRFINSSVAPFGSTGFTLSQVFGSVIMVVFLVNIVISILYAMRKLYNLFLGGK